MVRASRGLRHRTRKLLKKEIRERGAVPPLSLLMLDYKPGDKAVIKINPSVHHGMPHRRYHGRTVEIVGRRGRAYVAVLQEGSIRKTLFVRPEHLRPVQGTTFS
ncbi:MAG: 50S ribosomal protein L21e [Fervidicoccaceae archaeon]